ncbi:UNVERIFIED_ORG: hypothetical protein B2H98_06040 [Clostridium botulinum]
MNKNKNITNLIITSNGVTTYSTVTSDKCEEAKRNELLIDPAANIETIDHSDLLSQLSEDSKSNSHKVGLVYLCLDKNYKIVYVGSSSNTSYKRLMQSDRMRSDSKPPKITANDIGWEYGETIQYISTIITKNYNNLEKYLIYKLKPEFNTQCIQKDYSTFEDTNSLSYQIFAFSTDWLNSIYNDGFYNPNFKNGKIHPISKFMNVKNANSSNSYAIKKGDTHE